MTTDPIAAARALLDKVPPLFIDLDGDLCREGDGYNLVGCAATDDEPPFGPLNPVIWSAIPTLRDMVATLADALEAERAANVRACAHLAAVLTERDAKVAAAYEAAACVIDDPGNDVYSVLAQQLCCDGHMCGCQGATISDYLQHIIRALTPANAQAALGKMLAEARLEGWRAGRDAAADEARSCTHDPYVARAIRALPEPKGSSHG